MTLICIDPGHAASTAGKRSPDGTLREYEFNRAVARRLAYHLQRHGLRTMYSCNLDAQQDASLTSRCNAANNAKADLFVSLHANAYGTDWNNANGWEIFHSAGSVKGKALAEAISARTKPLGLTDRGVKTENFTVLTKTVMPAVLIEHEFMTNPVAVEKLKASAWREKWAVADGQGILDYLKMPWEEERMEKELTIKEAKRIVKEKAALEDSTIQYLADYYRYGDVLIVKLAKAMQQKG